MNFKLLINEAEFEAWKNKNTFSEDTVDPPKEFPCYARTVVQSWNCEEQRAVYLYLQDVKKMLDDLTSNAR